ncbi:MAG: hypothetical protein Greene041619_935 [Candidatus Peregrinibacteria bacterium Greene0416_19]|nr:MAG: hypothetical protein Greene041619_935 [Candidatus Peregrinibacteria bacterium Greene0416_19]
MRSRILESYKATLALTPHQREVLVGLILGDGHIEQSPCTSRARLKVEQRASVREYVQWLHDTFQEWVRGPLRQKRTFLKVTGKFYDKYCFHTFTHEAFLEYRNLFYRDGRKTVPSTIADYLTALGLATWFMDDGSVKSHQSRGRIINTHAFTTEEVQLLCMVLREKFQLEARPRKQRDGIQIYISGRSAETLQRLIEPHMISIMRYKLPLIRVNNSA